MHEDFLHCLEEEHANDKKIVFEYENNTYVLLFGWHTNYSNQTIYSWYITNNNICHTLYKEMINKINLVIGVINHLSKNEPKI